MAKQTRPHVILGGTDYGRMSWDDAQRHVSRNHRNRRPHVTMARLAVVDRVEFGRMREQLV